MISGGDAQTEWNIVMATAMLAMLPPALGGDADAKVVCQRLGGYRKINVCGTDQRSGALSPTEKYGFHQLKNVVKRYGSGKPPIRSSTA
jgi:hypothetical protein